MSNLLDHKASAAALWVIAGLLIVMMITLAVLLFAPNSPFAGFVVLMMIIWAIRGRRRTNRKNRP
jgi:Flp pilus assembly protein TadB